MERVLDGEGDDDALRRSIVGLDLESEQVLRLSLAGGGSVIAACGSLEALEAAVAKALPYFRRADVPLMNRGAAAAAT